MSTSRPTPETDAAEINLGSACGQFSEWYVKPSFARKLERERDEARSKLEKLLTIDGRLFGCGQYADKLLAPAPTSTPDDTPKPLQNQRDEVVSPSGIEPETL